ncbi:alpha/beta fold hydrolase [Kineosporia mesophila]|uniref:Alpha/beta fold hydrolase n=1 Tax=Kineosporia mesophila TaxID=566012 RepID=A0ABP6ZA66_9ACTN|nr:alpha/beta hydrolase [Kineosporia mesophila]MCD5354900.1 alpha/beta hydrolase [Kineosporia mesophila]
MTGPDTVVLLHGLWMTPLSWRDWVTRLEGRGYRVLTPSWPRMDRSIDELRADPSLVAGLGIAEIADHHARFIEALDRPPILMGHSLGGLLTQQMLDRGLGAAGVAIHPGQPRGVYGIPLNQVRAALPVLRNPLNRSRGVALTPAQFHFGFAGALSEQNSLKAWETFHVPAPGLPVFQAALANVTPHASTRVDFRKPDRAPLLLVAGGADRIVPSSVVRETHRRYRTGTVEYREFPGRSHFTAGEPGWEDVLDQSLEWVLAHL